MRSHFLTIVALASAAFAATNPCQYQFAATGPTWDFTGMKSDTPFHSWTARDGFNTSNPQGDSPGGGASIDLKEWYFMFNLCGNISPLPSACANNPNAQKGAMAVMYAAGAQGTPECRVLGGDFETLPFPYDYLPFDPDRVTKGFKIHFMGGETPASGSCKGDKYNTLMLEIGMICDSQAFPPTGQVDDLFILPKHYAGNSSKPSDVQDCEFEVIIPSTAGCPQECPLAADGRVCSDQGICRMDTDLGAPRCFCDDGYISKDCGTPGGAMPTGKIVGALFGGIFLGAAIVGVYYYAVHVMGNGAGVGGARTAAAGGEGDGYYEVDEH